MISRKSFGLGLSLSAKYDGKISLAEAFMSDSESSESRIVKLGDSPAASASMRRKRLPSEWKVPPQNSRASLPVSAQMRASIWLAALFVKVSSIISRGESPHSEISHATR